MADPYTFQSDPTPPVSALANAPMPPRRPITPQANLYAGPIGPAYTGPAQTPPQYSGLFGFLQSLFGGGGASTAPQGMTALLARGRGAPGTDNLGNPVGRF